VLINHKLDMLFYQICLLASIMSTSLAALVDSVYHVAYRNFLADRGLSASRLLDYGRLQAFTNTLKAIESHSKTATHSMGLTQFADWTDDELESMFASGMVGYEQYTAFMGGENNTRIVYGFDSDGGNRDIDGNMENETGYGSEEDNRKDVQTRIVNKDFAQIKTDSDNFFTVELNWASEDNPSGKPVTPPIQNQGLCGACWAFAAVAGTEAAIHIATHVTPVHLSTQELIDCDRFYDQGCAGGNPMFAFAYIAINGLCRADDYPYIENNLFMHNSYPSSSSDVDQNGPICRRRTEHLPVVATIDYFRILPSKKESAILRALKRGPVTVGICGADKTFLFYTGGIFKYDECCSIQNHAMLIIGYGEDEKTGLQYWIAQNSWGRDWGENGYMRIARSTEGAAGVCSLAVNPSMPIGGQLFNGGQATGHEEEVETKTTSHHPLRKLWAEVALFCKVYAIELLWTMTGLLIVLMLWDVVVKWMKADGGRGAYIEIGEMDPLISAKSGRDKDYL
jgi:hypothetical protein